MCTVIRCFLCDKDIEGLWGTNIWQVLFLQILWVMLKLVTGLEEHTDKNAL